MALNITNDPASNWALIKGLARSIKSLCDDMASRMAAQDVTIEYLAFTVYKILKTQRDQLVDLNIDGLNEYASSIRGVSVDVEADIGVVIASIDDALSWMDTNASGLSLTGDTFANALANDSVTTRRFTPAQTGPLQTRLIAISGGITS